MPIEKGVMTLGGILAILKCLCWRQLQQLQLTSEFSSVLESIVVSESEAVVAVVAAVAVVAVVVVVVAAADVAAMGW